MDDGQCRLLDPFMLAHYQGAQKQAATFVHYCPKDVHHDALHRLNCERIADIAGASRYRHGLHQTVAAPPLNIGDPCLVYSNRRPVIYIRFRLT